MKLSVRSLALLAASAALILASCAPATDAKEDDDDKVTPWAGVTLDFENGENPFVLGWDTASVITDTGTNATKVLSLVLTGTYSSPTYTFDAPVDFSQGRTLKLDLLSPADHGAVLVMKDAAGKAAYFWAAGTGAWTTNTFTVDSSGIYIDAENKGWLDGTPDMSAIVSFHVQGNEHVETILVDNISIK